MESLSHQEGELEDRERSRVWRLLVTDLVGVLTRGRDTDCAGPVVVQVGQLVRQLLQLFGIQARRVLQTLGQWTENGDGYCTWMTL